ncbi:MAG: D-aminoacyl-tRNA deacylase, partial [Actinomycetes bacterium]
MRVLLQRVARASVAVDGVEVGSIDGPGLLALVAVTHTDTDADARRLADKSYDVRIFDDERSAAELGAPVLVVSQFTLYADTRRGGGG